VLLRDQHLCTHTADLAFAAMVLETPYAAEAPERLSIYAGRTCGFAAEISVGLTGPELQRATDRPEGGPGGAGCRFGLLARDALSVLRPKSNLRVSSSGLDGITASFLPAARRASQAWPISRAVMFAS
jgi:hypothetical protein